MAEAEGGDVTTSSPVSLSYETKGNGGTVATARTAAAASRIPRGRGSDAGEVAVVGQVAVAMEREGSGSAARMGTRTGRPGDADEDDDGDGDDEDDGDEVVVVSGIEIVKSTIVCATPTEAIQAAKMPPG